MMGLKRTALLIFLSTVLLFHHGVVDGFITSGSTTTSSRTRNNSIRNKPSFVTSLPPSRVVTSYPSSLYSSLLSPKSSISSSSSSSSSSVSTNNIDAPLSNDNNDDLYIELCNTFQGDFDNYNQVIMDRNNGYLLPREGGGHEHIHCTLLPINHNERLAIFYFKGIPNQIFRFRHYQLVPKYNNNGDNNNNDNNNENENDELLYVDMQLSTLHPKLETLLRNETKYNVHNNEKNKNNNPFVDFIKLYENFKQTNPDVEITTLLQNCDVRWSYNIDPKQHQYVIDRENEQKQQQEQQSNIDDNNDNENDDNKGIHAVMVYGEAIVDSTIVPGMKIRIIDQLSLWQNEFYIHDRGFNPETNEYIYGNQRNIPYQLQRVSNIHIVTTKTEQEENDNNNKKILHRTIHDESLSWTLGPSYRTKDEYKQKMETIGETDEPSAVGPPRNKAAAGGGSSSSSKEATAVEDDATTNNHNNNNDDDVASSYNRAAVKMSLSS